MLPGIILKKVGALKYTLYHKCRIDTVQWCLEHFIRDPEINLSEGIKNIDK